MDRAAYNILYELDYQLLPIQAASRFSSNNIREKVLNINQPKVIFTYMVHLLKGLPLTDGLYWGDTKGDFIYVRKRIDTGFLGEIINRNVVPMQSRNYYLSEYHNIIKSVPTAATYDPRSSKWYKLAAKMQKSVWTHTYVYSHGKHFLGTTVATPTYDENHKLVGVFGIDVILDDLSKYVAKQKIRKHGQVFILDKNGLVIASPALVTATKIKRLEDVHAIDNPPLAKAFDIYHKTHQTTFQLTDNKINYLASFKVIPILSENGWMIASIDETTDFTGNLHRIEFFYIFVTVVLFIIGLILITNLVAHVVSPIKELVKETKKIKNFNLQGNERVSSRIKEVIELSDAIYSMKLGLRSFQKYVPSDLVRELLKPEADLRVQGIKTNLALFFSDIKDFTTITESGNTINLVRQICDYFEILAHNIVHDKGTIDKYIGDSIMAFWGAPYKVDSPCIKAAQSALNCLRELNVANALWKIEGKPQLFTRIAMHYGEAIVGSLGSSERLNYTAIGDSVNLTNRLLNINKFYGTSIIVTESFYKEVKDNFILRFIDNITVKGKIKHVAIYELMADKKEEIDFDIDRYQAEFTLGFKAYKSGSWEEAIRLFEKCLLIYPKDTLAPAFIKRCKHFIKVPPKHWEGIWNFTEK